MPDTRCRSGASSLTDLPPELWDLITNHLPTASSVASLGRTNKSLHTYVEEDGWKTFARARFPSICPPGSPQYSGTARSLSTLSRAWDRRALLAQYVEVEGEIWSFPGNRSIPRWNKPTGQTIGFAPRLDALEEVGARWQDRTETLAFSAGAGVCVRQANINQGVDDRRWLIYRPVSAREGRDDVTVLHLLEPLAEGHDSGPRLITGTANGDLRVTSLPNPGSHKTDMEATVLETDSLPVRSGSILRQASQPCRFVASLGDTRVALYPTDVQQSKIEPLSQIDILPPLRADGHPSSSHRVWTTSLLSATSLAVGTGASHEPIQVYSITPSGIAKPPLHRYELSNPSLAARVDPAPAVHQKRSSVYTIVPLPNTSVPGQLFLSGAYDGIVRLHDQRTPSLAVQHYEDIDDGAIYSLLPRGQEKLLAGTSRHNLLKVFDLRLGARCYSYLDATDLSSPTPADDKSKSRPEESQDFTLFLQNRSPSPARASGPRGGRGGRRGGGSSRMPRGDRIHDSSVYSLASPSPHSPYVYAGVENAVISVGFSGILDAYVDPGFFGSWVRKPESGQQRRRRQQQHRHDPVTQVTVPPRGEILSLAMYEQDAEMRLRVQRDVGKILGALRHEDEVGGGGGGGGMMKGGRMDERWVDAGDKM